MRIGIVHGYLLNGTGSNLYVQNLCRQFCEMGHDVILFCQDKELDNYDFIESGYELNKENTKLKKIYLKKTLYSGKCMCINPNIGQILPVYVSDDYKGFEALELTKINKENIENYILANENAIKTVIKNYKLDIIISNHTIMQPICTGRAINGLDSINKITVVHGSSLNFSVKKSKLLEQYAIEGLNLSDELVYLTDYSKEEFHNFFDGKFEFKGNEHVIPAGVDMKKFVPLDKNEHKIQRVEILLEMINSKVNKGKCLDSEKQIDQNIREKLLSINWEKDNIILYYGKYLWTKGIHNIILALPLILKEYPNTKLVLIGFGSSKKYLQYLVSALDNGDLNQLEELVRTPEKYQDNVESNSIIYSKWILDMLDNKKRRDEYLNVSQNKIRDKIIFTGFMNHDELSKLIPCADVVIAPSIFPEAFGLVGVEALACGVIPIQTYHSGFKCVVDTYSDLFDLDDNLKNIDKLKLNEHLICNIGKSLSKVIETFENRDEVFRNQIRNKARNICTDNYSWEFVANKFTLMK